MTIKKNSQGGYSLAELMVGLAMFSVVGASTFSFATNTLRTLSLESIATVGSIELKNALGLLSSEAGMSSSVSPYLVGTIPANVNCSANITATSSSLKFFVVDDDSSSALSGISPYYVGYRYDSSTKSLYRGEVASTSISSCVVPSTDPTGSVAEVLATDLVQIDQDGDGSLEPVFSLSGNILTVNLGFEATAQGQAQITQKTTTQIYLRTN